MPTGVVTANKPTLWITLRVVKLPFTRLTPSAKPAKNLCAKMAIRMVVASDMRSSTPNAKPSENRLASYSCRRRSCELIASYLRSKRGQKEWQLTWELITFSSLLLLRSCSLSRWSQSGSDRACTKSFRQIMESRYPLHKKSTGMENFLCFQLIQSLRKIEK